jgi:hypothetical protein
VADIAADPHYQARGMIMPTALANQFFDQLGQCMDAARQA